MESADQHIKRGGPVKKVHKIRETSGLGPSGRPPPPKPKGSIRPKRSNAGNADSRGRQLPKAPTPKQGPKERVSD